MNAVSKSVLLPDQVIVGERKYDVLGFFMVKTGKTWKEDRTKVVLKRNDEEIVTHWPMKVYKSLTYYEEIRVSANAKAKNN
jgi:hypothetical protein